jgi:hypothetical protein
MGYIYSEPPKHCWEPLFVGNPIYCIIDLAQDMPWRIFLYQRGCGLSLRTFILHLLAQDNPRGFIYSLQFAVHIPTN